MEIIVPKFNIDISGKVRLQVFDQKGRTKNEQHFTNAIHDDLKNAFVNHMASSSGASAFHINTSSSWFTAEHAIGTGLDGIFILVNRGWIEKDQKNDLKKINIIETNKYEGIIKKITRSNPFKPKNDIKNNEWYTLNLNDLKIYTGNEFSNYVLHIEKISNTYLQLKQIDPDLPNNHLKYAITWYSVAMSILIYFLYFRRKR